MKKLFFALLLVISVAAFAGYNMYLGYKATPVSDLLLANIEALASNEGGVTCSATAKCPGGGSVSCSGYSPCFSYPDYVVCCGSDKKPYESTCAL